MLKIGTYVKAKRTAANMTQRDLGHRLGYRYGNFIGMIEKGKATLPIGRWYEFAKALDAPEAEFFDLLKENHPHLKSVLKAPGSSLPEITCEPAPPKTVSKGHLEFKFETASITTIIDEEGNPWWIAKEVCEVLGLENVSKALIEIDPMDKREVTGSKVGRDISKLRLVNESGLYDLIFKSRKPQAKAFRRWVTHEVLPQIRKTGKYKTPSATPALPPVVTPLEQRVLEVVREYTAQRDDEWKRLALPLTRKNNELLDKIEFLEHEVKKLQIDLKRYEGLKAVIESIDEPRVEPGTEKPSSSDHSRSHRRAVSLTKAAKALAIPARKFMKALDDKILFREKYNPHCPKPEFERKGYFFVKSYGGYSKTQTVITPKGFNWIKRLFAAGELTVA